jgi:hypothetical protein
MRGLLGHAALVGAVHAALSCTTDSSGQAVCTDGSGLFAGLGIAILLIYLAVVVIGIIAAVKIVTKAGYSGWWVLIAFVPLVGSVFVLIFAFSTWPVTREVQMLRGQLAGVGGYGGGYGGRYGAPGPQGGGPAGYRGAQSGYGGGQGGYGVPAYQPPGPGLTPQDPAAPPSDTGPPEPTLPTFGQFIRGESDPVATPSTPAGEAPSAPTAPTPTAEHPPAGWFPSPGGPPGQQRYWDGTTWTDHYH